MTALEFICSIPHVPMFLHGNEPRVASNSQRRRWLENSSILINGKKPKPFDEIEFPIWQLIFFPKNQKSKCSFIDKE